MTTPFEADPADAAEQAAPVDPDVEAVTTDQTAPELESPEVPVADALEQAAVVEIDEEERR